MLLTTCASLALTTFCDERHESQTKVVGMIEEVLKTTQTAKQTELDAEVAKVAEFEAKRTGLAEAKEKAAELVKTRGEELNAASEALQAATTAKEEAAAYLKEKQDVQSTEDAGMIQCTKDKAALEAMIETAWKIVMAGEEDLEAQYDVIVPFFELLKADESMKSALPSCCKKKSTERGSFDTMVLAQFETLVKDKLVSLQKEIDEAGPAAKERASAVEKAQEALDTV